MTQWSESVIGRFNTELKISRRPIDESDFSRPYNTLLYELFPANEFYQVDPRYNRITGSIEFIVFNVARKVKAPVFFVEIKNFSDLHDVSSRTETDNQMRKRFLDYLSEFEYYQIPKIYGISAMGTTFAAYELTVENKQLLPFRVTDTLRVLVDEAPRAWWDHEILDDEGERKLRGIAAEVKEMVAGLKLWRP